MSAHIRGNLDHREGLINADPHLQVQEQHVLPSREVLSYLGDGAKSRCAHTPEKHSEQDNGGNEDSKTAADSLLSSQTSTGMLEEKQHRRKQVCDLSFLQISSWPRIQNKQIFKKSVVCCLSTSGFKSSKFLETDLKL